MEKPMPLKTLNGQCVYEAGFIPFHSRKYLIRFRQRRFSLNILGDNLSFNFLIRTTIAMSSTGTGTGTGTSTNTWGGAPPLGIIGGTEWACTSLFGKRKRKDMNRLILRSLANQGYDDAVKKFITEAGPESGMDLGIWIGFLEVQKDLKSGNVDDAVEKLNNLNPEILNKDLRLLCILLLQEFVELIRTGKVAEALEFSQERLAPVIKKNPPFFKDFAEITSLLYFKDDPDSPAAKFLDTLWRSKTANEVKDAILRNQGHEKDWNVNVPGLLKELYLVQDEMEKLAVYPGFGNVTNAERHTILSLHGSFGLFPT